MVPKKPTQFRSKEEIAARKAFIAGVDAAVQGDKWSVTDLKRLTTEDLLDRLSSITNQATLMRWRIFWAIRQHFDSDRLYGQYLKDMARRPEYANIVGSQQDVNRAWHAGEFCEKHNITDLDAIGVLKSSIYALSRPANADVADKIFHAVKRKNMANTEVERMIYEAKSITGEGHAVSTPQQIERIAYDKSPILVEKGVVQLPEVLEQIGEKIEYELLHGEAVVPTSIEHVEPEPKECVPTLVERRDPSHADLRLDTAEERRFTAWVNNVKPEYIIQEGSKKECFLKDVDYDDLLLELASRDASHLSEEQIVTEMVLLDERFRKSEMKLINYHMLACKTHQKAVYKK